MKKCSIFFACMCLLLSGCGTAAAAPAAEPAVRTGQAAMPLYYRMAENAGDLAACSDVILEFTVSETKCFAADDKVYTAVTPEILSFFFNDTATTEIYTSGGEMNFQEFYDAATGDMRSYLSGYSVEERKNGTYWYTKEGCIPVQPGERYLFFGSYLKSGDYAGQLIPLFEVDGFFACDDDTVYLDRGMFNEPLRNSLSQQFGLPEKDTDTQIALAKQALLDAVTG